MPRRQPRGEDGVEQVVGQAGAVRQLVHAACLGLHGAPEGEGALVGDGGQEPLIRAAVAAGGGKSANETRIPVSKRSK